MWIKKLILKNFRQFRDVEIDFERFKDHYMQIFLATNGTGKTTLLNAINWCLYGDEPHFTEESRFPLLNRKTIDESKVGDEKEVKVELWAHNSSESVKFIRKAIFSVYDKKERPVHQRSTFKVKTRNAMGDTDIHGDDDALDYVERFVPLKIREYFFFDGERLDKYFLENSGEKILDAAYKISKIELLYQARKHLNDTYEDLIDEASELNPELESLNHRKKNLNKNIGELKQEIRNNENQILNSKSNVDYYKEKLRGYPDVHNIREKIVLIKNKKNKKQESKQEKFVEKSKITASFGTLLMFHESVDEILSLINKKLEGGEIPPSNITPELVEEILENKICSLCGKEINQETNTKLESLLKELEVSTDIGTILTNMKPQLERKQNKIKQYRNQILSLSKDIKDLDEDIEEFNNEVDNLEQKLSGFNDENVAENQNELKKFEKSYEKHVEKRTDLDNKLKGEEEKLKEIEEELKLSLKNEKRLNLVNKQIDFVNKSLRVINEIIDEFLTETRNEIELETNKLFFDLIWKKKTYDKILIDDKYNIDVLDNIGLSCRGSLSAAEKQFLSLAFTLSLHKVSGYESPLIIDTPVSRVSDINRENFGQVFSKVSKETQIILLFTPSDYNKDVKKTLDPITKKCFVELSSDEKTAMVRCNND